MKIIYNENPLRTVVELDQHDRQIFWFKIKVEMLQDKLFDVHFNLTEGEYFNIERARKDSDPDSYIQENDQEKTAIDKRVDNLLELYVKELQGIHSGDCTCVPCSCMKCHAESILEINTLKLFPRINILNLSPGKHELAKINAAFSQGKSLNEVLAYLKDHKISREKPESWKNSTQEEYDIHIPRWEKEQAKAYEYLKNYAIEHFMVYTAVYRSGAHLDSDPVG